MRCTAGRLLRRETRTSRADKARTYIEEDLITVVLQDTLTKGERSLLRDGEVALVLANRKAFQNGMASDMIVAVERLSGRSTTAFLSANHIDPDIAVESFVLAPRVAHEAGVEEAEI
ncbi:MAG: Na-translocating system protein MpsC family protein [Solirubrobacterales bacterium]